MAASASLLSHRSPGRRVFTWLRGHRARWDLAAAIVFTAVALLVYSTAPLAYKPSSDGYYSWVYARSLAYDGDVDFTNDYAACGDPFAIGWKTPAHRPANFYYFGPAVFWTPAIWVVKHFVDGPAEVRNGCSGPLPHVVLAMACFAGGAVVLAMSALLRRWLNARVAAFAALLVAFGSPLLGFSSTQASGSHVYDAACIAAYLYVVVLLRERGSTGRLLILTGVLLGLAILQRASNAVFGLLAVSALLPALPSRSPRAWAHAGRSVAVVAGIAILTGIAPLLAVSRAIYGRPLLFAHGPHFLWPAHAHPLLLLFDERGGVFDGAPVLWLGVAGLVLLLRKRDTYWLVLPWLACAVFELVLSASAMDWQGGRRLLNLTPLGALCVGLVCERCAAFLRARPRARTLLAYGAPLAVVAWANGAVFFAVARGKIPWDRPVTASERYGDGQQATLAAIEDQIGPLADLPAAYVFALRYQLSPVAFGWAAHPAWYQRNLHSLDYDRSDFPFTSHDTEPLLRGVEIKAGTRGACMTGSQASAVFSLQWPFTTRVRLVYDATGSGALSVRSRSFFGTSFAWEGGAPLPPGTSQAVLFKLPPTALDSGINQVEITRTGTGTGTVCLLGFEFVDDTRYAAAPEADASPPVHLWGSLPARIDAAAVPSVTLGHDAAGPWAVELDETATGVEARSGTPGDLGTARVESPAAFAPRVASDPALGRVVEVEQGQREEGALWSRSGRVGRIGGQPVVQWTERTPYAAGLHPVVAVAAEQVVEIHTEGTSLAVRSGRFEGEHLVWSEGASPQPTGSRPAVAMTKADDGVWVVEVHQADVKFGPMKLRVGLLDEGGAIAWREAQSYDTGAFPSVAIYGHTVVEAHQGQEDPGSMWMKVGTFHADGTVTWRSIKRYDDGGHPVLALDAADGLGLEMHEGGKGLGALWRHDVDVY